MKRSRTRDKNFSNARSEGQGNVQSNVLSNQGPSNAPLRFNNYRFSSSKPHEGNSGSSYVDRPNCSKGS